VTGLLSAWVAEMVLIAYRGSKTGTTANNPIPTWPCHLSTPRPSSSTGVGLHPGTGTEGRLGYWLGTCRRHLLEPVDPGTLAKPTAPSPTATNTAQTTNADTGVAQRGA